MFVQNIKKVWKRDEKLLRRSNLLRHCGVVYNSKLKRGHYGRIGSNWVCFRNDRRCGACSFGEINKNAKRKRDPRRELQGRVNDCCKTLCNCGIAHNSELVLVNGFLLPINNYCPVWLYTVSCRFRLAIVWNPYVANTRLFLYRSSLDTIASFLFFIFISNFRKL